MAPSVCHPAVPASVATLTRLLRERKTRRFGCGMNMPAGPLRYKSEQPPTPLSQEEEHYLIFAAAGQTGPQTADMQFVRHAHHEDGQGTAMMNFAGRTVPSPCAAHATRLFYTNDGGVYFVVDAREDDRGPSAETVCLQEGRLDIPRRLPFMLSFNQWYANRPGSTFFIPVTNVALVYLNLLLTLFSEEYGYFVVDTDNGGAACGLDECRHSRGGHLHDDYAERRTLTLRDLDGAMADAALIEQGAMGQNIVMMIQAMGLGGGIQSVGSGRHLLGMEPQLFRGLGFLFEKGRSSPPRPNPVGLPHVWEGLGPPFASGMEEAVRGLVEAKFGATGLYGDRTARPWSSPEPAASVPPHSERSIEATIRFCEYVHATYGRFPAHADAFKSVIACQVHHLDLEFYDHFYPPGTIPAAQREHSALWHDESSRESHRAAR